MVTTGVIVTGGASGIGLASANALARTGRPVALWDIDGAKAAVAASDVSERHGVATIGIGLDVRDRAGFAEAIAQSRSALGTIGGLVHAAGVTGVGPIDVVDTGVWDSTVDIHLSSGALLIRDLSADLIANPGSAVVLISSIEGIVSHGAIPAYCAAKAGMLGLARSAGAHLGSQGVRVNAVCPGFIQTPLFNTALQQPGAEEAYNQRIPLGRIGVSEEIGNVVRFLLSEEASYVNCAEIVVDGGVSRTTF